jgi:hypothetical protein
MWNNKPPTEYLKLPQHEALADVKNPSKQEDGSSCVIGRYRVIASDPLPAMCDLMSHSLTNSNVVEACVVGGVLWKLQQFCRAQQRSQASGRFWRTQLVIWGVYGMLIVSVGMLLDGTTAAAEDDNNSHTGSIHVAGGIVVVTGMYLVVLALVGDKLLGTSQVLFRSKLDSLLQEMSAELQTIGYSVQVLEKKQR